MGLSVATEGKLSPCTISASEKEESLRASVALRSRLQGLLQATIRQPVGIGRRGSLSAKNLYRLSIGNPRIFTTKETSQGLSTAVHLLLDVSWQSMAGAAIKLSRMACYAVLRALSGIRGINPAVTAFPAENTEESVVPLVKHGDKMTPYLLVKTFGSTPLAQALWWNYAANATAQGRAQDHSDLNGWPARFDSICRKSVRRCTEKWI